MYSTIMLSNSVLSYTFLYGIYITPLKLQGLIYKVSARYKELTGKNLLEEKFYRTSYGVGLFSLDNKFKYAREEKIMSYIRSSDPNTLIISLSDESLKQSINEIWNQDKRKDGFSIMEEVLEIEKNLKNATLR